MATSARLSTEYTIDRDIATAVAADRPTLADLVRWQEFETQVRAYARLRLVRRPGWFILRGLEHLSEPESRRFLERLAGTLGEPVPHDAGGGLIREVVDRGAPLAAASTVRYSDTRHGGNLHTDGCHRPGPVPDLFALHCVRPARSGGALVLVHVDDLLDQLRRRPEVLAVLRRPVHFDTREERPGVGARTVTRPVLDTAAGFSRVNYLREYIDSAHRRPDVPPLSAEQIEAMDVLDALLDRTALQTRRRLRPGELIVVNNRAIVHGRTTFPAQRGPDARLLLRVWIGGAGELVDARPDPLPTGSPA